ncbi:helix-turn-helix transcriptional regulator [Micromonospora sp. WMMD882]|uniref:helix-turn-helix domain-containing protein n=1 Tax=Micromonospora sp. WMMD882 TaxID=3015151 RepID=UPI00248B3C53|nr:helix-turn-helix transcriptional regulator [Micromonospora sp. WMMD882]WBB81838.1 helix-turn-helix transcriptional regulator [Micromonospora sp. WMMD882]
MVLLRRVIGDALRARRQGQHRTLREVSSAANVSLGYLSEIERGQKEPSSELLAAICDALGARLSELLREVSDTVALAEQMPGVLVPVVDESVEPVTRAGVRKVAPQAVRQVGGDGSVAVAVRQDSPLKATLRSARVRPAERDVVCAA